MTRIRYSNPVSSLRGVQLLRQLNVRLVLCLLGLTASPLPIFPSSALAQSSWAQAILNVERLQGELSAKADALGAPHLGSAYGATDAMEHRCAILGRLLGKTDLIAHLEEPLPSVSETGYEFRVAVVSLDNWLMQAQLLLDLPENRKTRLWNMDCVGRLGIPPSAQLNEEHSDAFYDVTDDGLTLYILGSVTQGFYERLVVALNDNPRVQIVALGSGGGLVTEALSAGTEIRKRRLETVLWNDCYSACPLVFMGGTRRMIFTQPGDDLGFHQISVDGTAVSMTDPIYELVSEYSEMMGADGRGVVALMMSATPDEIYNPSGELLCNVGVATWVQRVCSTD